MMSVGDQSEQVPPRAGKSYSGTQLQLNAAPLPCIEPGIAPLCEALNRVPEVATIWSCEGHPYEGHRPYVVFAAPQSFAFELDRALCHRKQLTSGLSFVWRVTATFRDDGTLQWTLDPNDERFYSRGLFGRSRWSRMEADKDIAILSRIVDALRGKTA